MKAFRYTMVLALTAALISPVFAEDDRGRKPKEIDVCVNPAAGDFFLDDADGSGGPTAGDGIAAVGAIYPGGSIPEGGVASCDEIDAPVIGKFFARGRLLAALAPPPPPNIDIAYVDWHFRLDGLGAIDTSGPVRSSATYPQTIVGATRRLASFAKAGKGEAITEVLDAAGFQIRLVLRED